MEVSNALQTPISSPSTVFFKRWAALTIAFIPGVLVGATALYVWALRQPSINGRDYSYDATQFFSLGAMFWVLSLVFVPVFSVLGAPLLAMHRLIIGPRRPFFRLGYAAVALYGPIFLLIISPAAWLKPQTLLGPTLLYEVVALIATLAYLPLANWWGVLDGD